LLSWGTSNYERSCPMIFGQCAGDYNHPKGTVHLIVGSGGQLIDGFPGEPLPWSLFRSTDYGYVRLDVPDANSFRIQYVRALDGQITDDVWLYHNSSFFQKPSLTVLFGWTLWIVLLLFLL